MDNADITAGLRALHVVTIRYNLEKAAA